METDHAELSPGNPKLGAMDAIKDPVQGNRPTLQLRATRLQ